METLNHYNHVNGKISRGESAEQKQSSETAKHAEKKEHPAHSLMNGRIMTRIWAEQNDWGSITWRVDQYRMPVPNYMGGKFRSFHVCDLQDAMRGLYEAKRWIKQTEKQSRRWFRW